mmetsp:Transcript_620/g.1803  ORF Transcript_620/g.1803 Transcript_620/m.1803 type:complete len:420 (+) Transcript_620:245-1504(+)
MSLCVLVGILFLPKFDLGQDLVGEGARHDEGRVTSGAAQVEQAAFGKNDDTVATFEDKLVNLWLDVDALGTLHESFHINFIIEVTNVSNNGVVLHLGHLVGHDDTLVTSSGDENVASRKKVFKSVNLVSFHGSLKGADRINFGHVNDATAGAKGVGATLTDITVSADDSLLTGKHDIGGTHDTIGQGVLASVQVVELGLSDRVIDVDGFEEKGSGLFHGVQTVDTGGGFLRNTHASGGDLVPLVGFTSLEKTLDDGKHNLEFGIVGGCRIRESSVLEEGIFGLLTFVDEEGHVATIINNKVRSMTLAIIFGPGDGVQSAFPVLFKRFSLPGENSGRFITGNGSSGVVLGGENVTGAPADVTTKLLQSLNQDSGLDGHVKRTRDTGTLQNSSGSEFFTACHKTRHLDLSEFNVLAAIVGK